LIITSGRCKEHGVDNELKLDGVLSRLWADHYEYSTPLHFIMLLLVAMNARLSIKAGAPGRSFYPLAELSHSVILGSAEFVAEIKEQFLKTKKPDRDLPALRSLSIRPTFDQIEKAVDSALRSDEKVARQVKFHLCHRHSGRKLREIGSRYGMGLSGVTQASHRISLNDSSQGVGPRQVIDIAEKVS
jgi:hypothetical protein